MKRIFDFIFCDGIITPNVVWYSVRVGSSVPDQRAQKRIQSLAEHSSDYLFSQHTLAMAAFKEKVAASIFPVSADSSCSPILLLRQKQVEVTWLARFLRHHPAALLNSTRQDTCLSHAGMQLLNGVSLMKNR